LLSFIFQDRLTLITVIELYALMEFMPPPKGEDKVVMQKAKIPKNSCLIPRGIGIGSRQNEQGIGLKLLSGLQPVSVQ